MVERAAAGLELGERPLDSPHAICRGYDIRRRFACVQLAKLQLESPVRLCGFAATAARYKKPSRGGVAAREGTGFSTSFFYELLAFHPAKMANLMIIVFLVEAAVKLINAIGAAKINDLVCLTDLVSSLGIPSANSLPSLAAMDAHQLPPRADLQGRRRAAKTAG
jgi:hypothetical protein